MNDTNPIPGIPPNVTVDLKGQAAAVHGSMVQVLESVRLEATATVTARLGDAMPAITLAALLDFGEATDDGRLVEAVALPWFEIMVMIQRDPTAIYQIDSRRWEEIIAGAYRCSLV